MIAPLASWCRMLNRHTPSIASRYFSRGIPSGFQGARSDGNRSSLPGPRSAGRPLRR